MAAKRHKVVRNPIVFIGDKLIYIVTNDGDTLEIIDQKTYILLETLPCPKTTYYALLAASALEHKIFVLRDKYEKETIDMTMPPSWGVSIPKPPSPPEDQNL